jgi:hypothetical protein
VKITQIAKNALKTLDNNSPVILTGLAVTGFVATIATTVTATWKARKVIDDYEKKENGLWIQSSLKERIQLTYIHYIPVVGLGLASIACVVGAQSINSKRQAALISGFTLAESAFREYREKVTEHMGETKEQKVRDEIAQAKMDANPPSQQVFITGTGDQLCYDTLSGRYFWSTMEKIRRAQNDINQQCINEMYASQNDFYRLVGLPINGFGEELGWSTDVMLDIDFTGHIVNDEERFMGMPCIALTYRMTPIRGYDNPFR